MRTIIWMAALIISSNAAAQDSTLHATPFTISGYVEGYFSYDFSRPVLNARPDFLYNFNRHNEFNLNLGLIKAGYLLERVRANLALAAGTYMNANYASEPATLQNLYEANAGYRLSGSKNLWIDIGIMPSHIGFESAIGIENRTLTRSLAAENSPYFESGARLSYTSSDGRLQLAALALNGWQRITRVAGNSLMSWGTQVYFKPHEQITLNYSTFIGTDKPDSARLWRYYHDVYGIFQFSPGLGLTAGFDIGMEQASRRGSALNTWYTPVVILRITPNTLWAIAIRGEYFRDKNEVVVSTGTPNGFKTFGGSVNLDYLPGERVALRLEARYFKSKDAIFMKTGSSSDNNTAITFSTALSF